MRPSKKSISKRPGFLLLILFFLRLARESINNFASAAHGWMLNWNQEATYVSKIEHPAIQPHGLRPALIW